MSQPCVSFLHPDRLSFTEADIGVAGTDRDNSTSRQFDSDPAARCGLRRRRSPDAAAAPLTSLYRIFTFTTTENLVEIKSVQHEMRDAQMAQVSHTLS